MVSVVTYKFDELALALAVCGPSSYTEGQDVSLILFKIIAAARRPRHQQIITPTHPVAQRRPISARITTIRSTRPSPLLG